MPRIKTEKELPKDVFGDKPAGHLHQVITVPSPREDELADKVRAMIAAKQVAEIVDGEWVGEPEWPIFIGYPFDATQERFKVEIDGEPQTLIHVFHDTQTHCGVYVREDLHV